MRQNREESSEAEPPRQCVPGGAGGVWEREVKKEIDCRRAMALSFSRKIVFRSSGKTDGIPAMRKACVIREVDREM